MGTACGPVVVLLPGSRIQYELDGGQLEYRRVYQEAGDRGAAVYGVLRGEHHWTADVQGERGAGVSQRLYCVSRLFHVGVVTLTGQDAGGVYGQAGVDYSFVCIYVFGESAKGSDERAGVRWG